MNNGSPDFWGHSKDSLTRNDLSILSLPYHIASSWKSMLQYHGIISAFVKLRELIGHSDPLTSYRALLYSHFLDEFKNYGLDYLIDNKKLKITTREKKIYIEEPNIPDESNRIDYGKIDNKLSSYMNSIICLNKNIIALSDLQIGNYIPNTLKKGSKYRIPAHFLEFNNLLRANSKQLRHILNGYKPGNRSFTNGSYIHYVNSRNDLFACLEKENKFECSLSDKLYVKYQLEHYFNFDMIDCLFQNIKYAKENLNYDMTTQADLNILSSCLLLPNVFGRHYLIQMAFDILKYNYLYDESFFFTLKNDPDTVVSKINSAKDILSKSNKLHAWMDLYQRFIRYLIRFYFPVYENVFFVFLYNDLKSSYSEKRDDELLADLYIILSKYLSQENVYDEILSIDTKIIQSETTLNKFRNNPFSKECIIQPKFNSHGSLTRDDSALYGRCLMAAHHQSRSDSAPDFINLDYLKSLVDKPDERIQAYYVIGSSAPNET